MATRSRRLSQRVKPEPGAVVGVIGDEGAGRLAQLSGPICCVIGHLGDAMKWLSLVNIQSIYGSFASTTDC